MIALDGRLATSFTAGLLAAINPCGFVLLPTYLVYFLGMENLRPGVERASLLRALKVSLAVSGGIHERLPRDRRPSPSCRRTGSSKRREWVSLVIGLGLLVLGIAMLFGYRLPFTTPQARRRPTRPQRAARCTSSGWPTPSPRSAARSARSRRSCSVASAPRALEPASPRSACTESAWRWWSPGLTVTLAFANTALLHILRRGMAWFEQLAGVLLILTGMYLCWYWYSSITDGTGGAVVAKATSWNDKLRTSSRNTRPPSCGSASS